MNNICARGLNISNSYSETDVAWNYPHLKRQFIEKKTARINFDLFLTNSQLDKSKIVKHFSFTKLILWKLLLTSSCEKFTLKFY